MREHYERRLATGAARLRCLEDVEERLFWRETLAREGRDGTLLDPDGAAAAARRARRAMQAHGIPRRALEAAGGEEAELLAGWLDRFERHCRDLDCIPADDLLAEFPAAPEPVFWVESPAWRPAARRWLDAHAQGTIAPPAAARRSALGCHAASADLELAAAADWLRARLTERPDFRAWVLIPDLAARRAEVTDAFDAALAPQRFRLQAAGGTAPYALAGGTPLADFAHVAAALEMLALARGPVPFERFSALLRAPGLAADAGAAAASARLDMELRGAAPAEASLGAWLDLAERLVRRSAAAPCSALSRLRAAQAALDAAAGAAPMSRWVQRWVRAFDAAPWADRDRWSSEEFQSVERFRELLAALASADALFGTQSAAAAAGLLAAAARDTAFQPQTGIAPLWITAAIGDPWLTYDALWIGGLTADAWPSPVDPVPLLPVELQRRYGIESASAVARLETAIDLGRRWALRAPTAVFAIADAEEAGAAAFSPLLPTGLAPLDASRAHVRPLWSAQLARPPELETVVDERAPPFAPPETTRGVATLRAQSLCAFRGFAESRLRCDPLRRPVPGFDAAERGRIVHAALERIWRALGDRAGLAALAPAARTALIAEAAGAAVEDARAHRDPGEHWRRRERERLERLLDRWLELESQRTDFRIERLEQDRQIARHAGLTFTCRIDRVDRLADGALVLLDYKTGSAAADWRGERPANPQLPLYAGLVGGRLVAAAYAVVNAADCRFIVESERDGALLPKRRRSKLEGTAGMRELLDVWRSRLDRLAAEFRDGRADVDPAPGACESCGLHAFCRVAGIADASEDREGEPDADGSRADG